MTEQLHFHFSLSCIGEENGSLLQCSFPENPRDGGAWWAAVYGVTQSRTRLKRLSSSKGPISFFCIWLPSCPSTFAKKTILFSLKYFICKPNNYVNIVINKIFSLGKTYKYQYKHFEQLNFNWSALVRVRDLTGIQTMCLLRTVSKKGFSWLLA